MRPTDRPSAFHKEPMRDPMERLLPTHAAIGSAIAANGAAHAQLGADALALQDEETFQRALEAQLQLARRGSFLTGYANEAVPEQPIERRMASAIIQMAHGSAQPQGEVAEKLQELARAASPPPPRPIRPTRVQYGGGSSSQARPDTPRQKRAPSGPQRTGSAPRVDAFVQQAIDLAATQMANESAGGVLMPKAPRVDPAVVELERRIRRRATQEPPRERAEPSTRAASLFGRMFENPRQNWRGKVAAAVSSAAATALALQGGMLA
jgi:hypothetical protein